MDFGGIMRFTSAGAQRKLRGKVETNPSNVKVDGLANQDGSTSRKVDVVGFRAKVTFEDGGPDAATAIDWDAELKAPKRNMTLIEDQTRTLHTWTGAQFTGDASVDRMSGEVTGLEILADTYKKTAA